jgi:hypothetical protein
MALYIRSIDWPKTTFPQSGKWDFRQLADADASNLLIQEISCAPAGKHSLDECPEYEREWREVAPAVIDALLHTAGAAVVRASGPFECDGLVRLLKYVGDWHDQGVPYHIAPVTSHGGRGYQTSWVAFGYNASNFARVVQDKSLDFESIALSVMISTGMVRETDMNLPISELGLKWALENKALAVASSRHFEGCYVLGHTDGMIDAIRRLRERAPGCVIQNDPSDP